MGGVQSNGEGRGNISRTETAVDEESRKEMTGRVARYLAHFNSSVKVAEIEWVRERRGLSTLAWNAASPSLRSSLL